jgi:antitoxin component of RelBE/YafQ-DinJ toxin-antitoxin module
MNNDTAIIVRVDKDMKEQLQKIADKDSRTISSLIRHIMKKVISGEIKL